MGYNYFAKIKALEKKNKERLLAVNHFLVEESGIYILTRVDENGFKYAYIGQAKNILSRLCQHLLVSCGVYSKNPSHIDSSLKKHGLYNKQTNPYGWDVYKIACKEEKLDELERKFIKGYAEKGFQLRNKTIGGQNCGKDSIDENTTAKGYYDGLKQGYKNAQKFVSNLFSKNLKVEIQGKDGVLKQRALEKFNNFINEKDI